MKPLPYVISKKAVSDLDELWFYTVEIVRILHERIDIDNRLA